MAEQSAYDAMKEALEGTDIPEGFQPASSPGFLFRRGEDMRFQFCVCGACGHEWDQPRRELSEIQCPACGDEPRTIISWDSDDDDVVAPE